MSEVTKQEQERDDQDDTKELEDQEQPQVIQQCITMQGIDYYIERENFYNHYYMCNPYVSEVCANETDYRADEHEAYQGSIYLGSQYNGSYIHQNTSTGEQLSYWYYPFYNLYPCYGNYAYNKPKWLEDKKN